MMLSSEVLRTNEYLVSPNNRFIVVMQPNGNLCEYFGSSLATKQADPLWCSNSTGSGDRFTLVISADNNLCICPGDKDRCPGSTIWCTTQTPSGPVFANLDEFGAFSLRGNTPLGFLANLWANGVRFYSVSATPPTIGTIQWFDGTVCPPDCTKVVKRLSDVTVTAIADPVTKYGQNTGFFAPEAQRKVAGCKNPVHDCDRRQIAGDPSLRSG